MYKICSTADSSNTIFSSDYGEHYHSIYGAKNESQHIFINIGLKSFHAQPLNILEIGYGSGLNALLTFIENKNLNNQIFYHGIELNILPSSIYNNLKFNELFNLSDDLILMFYEKWGEEVVINNNFRLLKEAIDFNDFIPINIYDVIYFDAFSPDVQPDLWSYNNLKKITDNLTAGGKFVTYCAKGIVKQRLRALGLSVKRCAGPAGKRHVIEAVKS